MDYRREIDGLRAIAVLPVILFHAGFSIFSGGFIGVDVFFVISGFLITSILIDELERNDFSIARFYERRARRILPALFVVLLACIPFAWMWMLPWETKDFAQSVVATILFSSNILFWRESGYFESAAELKPLLHTWSLAVEEQYYIILPVLLFLLWRCGRHRALCVIVAISSVSLLMSEYGWRQHPEANFFLTPTRAWELLAGSICAFLTVGKVQRASNLLSAAGLALIVFSIFYYDSSIPFPSLYTLTPVVGTALVLLYAHRDTFVARLLSTSPLVGIGLISYSAYLWHQPLFAFARILSLTDPSLALMGGLAIASLLLATLTWKYIEQPFRGRSKFMISSRRSVFSVSAIFSIFLIASSTIAASTVDAENNYSGLKKYAKYDTDFMRPKCFLTHARNKLLLFDKKYCLSRASNKKNVLLIGNSHAAHFAQALVNSLPDSNVMQATASGCTALLPLRGEKRCVDLFQFVYNEYLPDNRVDLVVLSSRIQLSDIKKFTATLDFLSQYADHVLVVGPVPEYKPHLFKSMIKAERFGYSIDYVVNQTIIHDRAAIDRDLEKNLRGRKGVLYFSVWDAFCRMRCPVYTKKGELFTFDYGHVSRSAALEIVNAMMPREFW